MGWLLPELSRHSAAAALLADQSAAAGMLLHATMPTALPCWLFNPGHFTATAATPLQAALQPVQLADQQAHVDMMLLQVGGLAARCALHICSCCTMTSMFGRSEGL